VVVALRLILADSLWTVSLGRSSGLPCLQIRRSIGPTSPGGFTWVFRCITSPSNLPA